MEVSAVDLLCLLYWNRIDYSIPGDEDFRQVKWMTMEVIFHKELRKKVANSRALPAQRCRVLASHPRLFQIRSQKRQLTLYKRLFTPWGIGVGCEGGDAIL